MVSSFSVYYFFSNIGSFFGELLGPVLRQYAGFDICIGYFTACIISATLVFILTRPLYRRVPPKKKKTKSWWKAVKAEVWEIRHILKIFIPLPIFWALFYQQNSTWVFQGQSMDCSVGPIGRIPQFQIPPDIMPSIEDIFCLLLIFLFDRYLYPFAERRGFPLRPLRKIGIGYGHLSLFHKKRHFFFF